LSTGTRYKISQRAATLDLEAPSEERSFRPDVQGLRAVAVALVVLYHASVPGISAGFIGVDVFFVISGFVITSLLAREYAASGRISLVQFYARRARRILPAASVVTVVTVVATYHFLGVYPGLLTATDGRWAALFSANVHFGQLGTSYLGAEQPPSPLQHMWSLGVEEQFYLVWPAIFLLATVRATSARSVVIRLLSVLLVAILVSYAWSIIETASSPAWAFFSPFTRACELALGALVAIGAPFIAKIPGRFAPWVGFVGLTGVIASAVVFTKTTPFPGSAAFIPTASTALIVIAGGIRPSSLAEGILRVRPLQFLGSRSYSIYLWHWPLLIIAAEHAGKPVLPFRESAVLVLVAIVIADLTYRLIENPIRRSHYLREHPLSSIALGAGLVGVTFVAMGLAANVRI
jgi:peptidoglycan/LPS O-acetylase OafA/YrhL